MKQTEKVQIQRAIVDEKNIALMKIINGVLEESYNAMQCYGDCESCVLCNEKESECFLTDICKMRNKILRILEDKQIIKEENNEKQCECNYKYN